MPETATRISGKTYVMDENPSGWKSLSITFEEGKPEAVATLVDSTGENRVAIGLDNVYRTTEMPDGNSINVRGQWEDENTFVQRQVQPQPDLEEALIRLEFTGDELNIHGDEVIQDKYSVDMHGVAK